MDNAVAAVRADVCAEQQTALETLRRKGLSLADVARLVVTTVNSVAAWRDGEKPAAWRTRRRLLELSAMPEGDLKGALTGASARTRGRLPASEEGARMAAMRAAGLWPMDVCARRIGELSKGARARGVSSTDLIEFLVLCNASS